MGKLACTRHELQRSRPAVFALATPFVLIHAGRAWDATSHVNRLAPCRLARFRARPADAVCATSTASGGRSALLLALGLAGLVVALWRRRRADLVLASFAIAYWLTLMPQRAHFDRYVLPLVPVLGVLAARVRFVAPLALALLVVPLVWSIGDARTLTRTDTRAVAVPLVKEALPEQATVAADPSTPPIGRRVLDLQLPGPGRPTDSNRNLDRLRSNGVRYVLVTGAVTDRVLAARSRYPVESSFYDALGRLAPLVDVEPGHGLTGPWVRLYDIG